MAASSNYEVERTTRIEAAPSAVIANIVDFKKWQAWSPWEDLDPALQRTYSGADSGVGAVYEWSGNRKAGAGRMEILDVEPDRSVTIDVRFVKPFKSHSTSTFSVTPASDSASGVTWSMTGPKTFMTKVMGIFTSMDKMIGPDFEKGLARLKTVAERGGSG